MNLGFHFSQIPSVRGSTETALTRALTVGKDEKRFDQCKKFKLFQIGSYQSSDLVASVQGLIYLLCFKSNLDQLHCLALNKGG